ncbi:hypothetical protein ACJMK2_044056 [Sinanodonta woodiana]|uniref:Alpha-and gamma-adaptin-binding protein p34 n=1 Tax=Sinanodonta woodiana TaxID=1069815 RepID=A0ABD3VYW4_SINWO
MSAPCVLIASCCDIKPDFLVKEILKLDDLGNRTFILEKICAYDWNIETKYYNASVQLCTTEERTIGNASFAERVEAFLVCFDPHQKNSFDSVKSWLPYLSQLEPEIKMLVCDQCTENHEVKRLTVQEWCIDNGFELVELTPEEDSDEDDDFPETTGIKRIIQALHAHTWSNLTMKENPSVCSPYVRQLMQDEFKAKKAQENQKSLDCALNPVVNKAVCDSDKGNQLKVDSYSIDCEISSGGNPESQSESEEAISLSRDDQASSLDRDSAQDCCKSDKKNISKEKKNEVNLDLLHASEDLQLFEALGTEDPGGESFEKLFERFGLMNEKAQSLPYQERKKYAEKVAIAFWRAMGGDEDEVEGLSDTDDLDP